MKKLRWVYVALGLVTMIFLGLIYAWSVFVGPLEAEFSWTRDQTSLTFSICMSGFFLGSIAAGFASRRLSARVLMCASAVLVLLGFVLTSRINSLLWLYIFYGVLCGFGVGIGYNSVMSTVLRWFPDRQGLISGMMLMGFGFGGMILGSIATALMNSSLGWRGALLLLGVIMGALIIAAALILRVPTEKQRSELPAPKVVSGEDVKTSDMLKTRTFWMLSLLIVFISITGLSLLSNAKPLAQMMFSNAATATLVGGLVSIGNGAGRFFFGFFFDLAGSKLCLLAITLVTTFGMILLVISVFAASGVLFIVGFLITGFGFGGITPCTSAYSGRIFGQTYYPANIAVTNLSAFVSAFAGPYSTGLFLTSEASNPP